MLHNDTAALEVELSDLYKSAMESLFTGNYDKTIADLEAANEKMIEAQITTFTPTTDHWVNPTTWVAIKGALEMGLGNYQRATELALQVLNERELVLEGDKTHIDYIRIRFLLIQIKMEEENYKEALQYLNEIADYFKSVPERPTAQFSSLYLHFLTYNAICQNMTNTDNHLFKSNLEIALDHHKNIMSNPSPVLSVIQMHYCLVNAELDIYDKKDKKNRESQLKLHEKNFQTVKELMNHTLGEKGHLTKIRLSMNYARMYVHFEKYGLASKVLFEAKTMLRQILPKQKHHGCLVKINLEITKLFVAMGIPEAARTCLNRAEDYLINNPNPSLQKKVEEIGLTFKSAPLGTLVAHSLNATSTTVQTPESDKNLNSPSSARRP